jgi:hypothetical protein
MTGPSTWHGIGTPQGLCRLNFIEWEPIIMQHALLERSIAGQSLEFKVRAQGFFQVEKFKRDFYAYQMSILSENLRTSR